MVPNPPASPHSPRGLSDIPSIDHLLRQPKAAALKHRFGHAATVDALREASARLRTEMKQDPSVRWTIEQLLQHAARSLEASAQSSLRPVFNLTGTVLHTNLGRALLAEAAVKAVLESIVRPCNLEYDIAHSRRGDRDEHLEALLQQLTGAEACTVVNNNAAAVFLLLNTLALRKEVVVSRGELIEIGGAFRIPDIMARAGARLREVGTTNRTHLKDYAEALGPRSGLIMKVHCSNYAIAGFTASVAHGDLAKLARQHGVPFVEDLGSGTLIDLSAFGLPHEPTAEQAIAAGADLVTFSGDKLLGGPQAGIIVGSRALITRLKRNPLKRALRIDKMTLAALAATLNLYRAPELLAESLPTLRLLTRTAEDITALAQRIRPKVTTALAARADVSVRACLSQIGSGSLPVDLLRSTCLVIEPKPPGRGANRALQRLAEDFRRLPIPVLGRIESGSLRFDLRCLEDEAEFVGQLDQLAG